MSPILSSQGMVVATVMAVSGTIILLAFRLQKSPSTPHFPPSCIVASGREEKRRKEKKKKKKKKKVHFAEDVEDPTGNGDEYRKLHSNDRCCHAAAPHLIKYSNPSTSNKAVKVEQMPANRVALYNGILRDRILHRGAYSC